MKQGMTELVEMVNRPVAVVIAIFGVMLLFYGYSHGAFYAAFPGILFGSGLALFLLGGAIAIFGNPAARGKVKTKKAKSVEELKEDIAGRSFPFVLCLKKRDVVDFVGMTEDQADEEGELHMDCNIVTDHVEITSEEDLRLALTNLGTSK